jgi:hypothetical protein
VGYAENHSKDVYRMLNLKTNAIINSRDIIWLKKMHKDCINIKPMSFSEEEEVLELPSGKERMKINETCTNVTEDESNKSDKSSSEQERSWRVGLIHKLPKQLMTTIVEGKFC